MHISTESGDLAVGLADHYERSVLLSTAGNLVYEEMVAPELRSSFKGLYGGILAQERATGISIVYGRSFTLVGGLAHSALDLVEVYVEHFQFGDDFRLAQELQPTAIAMYLQAKDWRDEHASQLGHSA